MIEFDNLTYIGSFGKRHGYKGEINLGFAQFMDDRYLKLKKPLYVEIEGCMVPFFPFSYRTRGQEMKWLVTLLGVDGAAMGLDKVMILENKDIYGIRDEVMALYPYFMPEQEMDIEGRELVDEKYGKVGTILVFDDSTENMLLTVRLEDGREVVLPFNFDFITSTYEDTNFIITRYPDGLLESLLDPDYEKDIPDADE